MLNPEQTLLLLNVILVVIVYFVVLPARCGDNMNKILANDAVATAISIAIAGYLFWGSQIEFSLFFFEVNWFWFAFISYMLIEIPFALWYFRKHQISWLK